MYRPSSSRSGMSSSSRSKESSGSGSRSSRSGASTRGRSPRRSRSPSPRGRRHRSPFSSRSSRRSPSPRRTSRVRFPSGGSRSRRGSEQRDGSLSRTRSPRWHLYSSQRYSQFLGRYSPNRHSESSMEQSLRTELSSNCYDIDTQEQRRLSNRLALPVDSLSDVDRDCLDNDSEFIRGLSHSRRLQQYHPHEECPPNPFSMSYDKDCCGKDAFLHQSDYFMNDDHLQDLPRDSDRDGKLFTKSLDPSEEEGLKPKHPRYDGEDRQLDVNTDPQGFLSGKRNYYRLRFSRSPVYPDKDFGNFESARRKREEDLSRNTSQDNPGNDYVICGLTNALQSSESQYFYRPEEAPAVPKKSILKKQLDDPSMQNLEEFLRQKDHQESMSESADLHDDFLLPHERASQDGTGFLRILDRMVDSTNAQEKRTCNFFLDVDDEEKFLYGDDQDDADVKYPSTEKLMNSWKESISLNARSPSPIHFIKPDTLDGSRIAFEKIRDLLKTIGLDIGVVEIGKGAARTEEQLHGKKTLCFLDGNSVVSHKPNFIEENCIQSNSHSPESNQKNSLSPCDFFQPSNDVSSISVSEYGNSRTLGHNNSAGTSKQSFFPVPVIPSTLPSLPNLPLPTPLISRYPVSYFSAYTATQLLPNHPPPTMAPPIYNAHGFYMTYSASTWPMYTPLHQSNPALPDVHGLVSVTVPPKPTRANLRVIETVSTVKENPKINRNNSVLVEIPITPTNYKLLSQSNGGTTERVSDEKYLASEMPKWTRSILPLPQVE